MTPPAQYEKPTPMDGPCRLERHAHYICVFRHRSMRISSYRTTRQPGRCRFFNPGIPEKAMRTALPFRRFLDGGAEGFDGDAHAARAYSPALSNRQCGSGRPAQC